MIELSTASMSERPAATERSMLCAVAVPTEHGGWGLTLEPVLLGLVVAFSWSGLATAVAVETQVFAGAFAVAVLAAAQSLAMRRDHIPPVKVIGLRQMAAGVAVVAATAVGVLA